MSNSWQQIVTDVSAIIGAVAPVLEATAPSAGAIVTVAAKILAGVDAAEPTAVALYNQIKSGTPVTAVQLQAAIAAYDAIDDQLQADIAGKLAALG